MMERTIWYHRKGIYVLWLLQWTPELDNPRYSPSKWEKWVHGCYFGRVHYWVRDLQIAVYSFEPTFKSVPRRTWIDAKGRERVAGGRSMQLKRYKSACFKGEVRLTDNFGPQDRLWWQAGELKIPDAKLWTSRGFFQELRMS